MSYYLHKESRNILSLISLKLYNLHMIRMVRDDAPNGICWKSRNIWRIFFLVWRTETHKPGPTQGLEQQYHCSRILSWGLWVFCYSYTLSSILEQLLGFSFRYVVVHEHEHTLSSQHLSPQHLPQQRDLFFNCQTTSESKTIDKVLHSSFRLTEYLYAIKSIYNIHIYIEQRYSTPTKSTWDVCFEFRHESCPWLLVTNKVLLR